MFEELRRRDLLVKKLPRRQPRTTQSRHALPVMRNEIKDRVFTKPNAVWVADLTYLRTEEGYLYTSLITDKVSRKIVGYYVGENLESMGCVKALEMALADLPEECHPIHHSDRGGQYCCHEYIGRLQARALPISMTETDHCAENALAERVNGILKGEYYLGGDFASKEVARQAVDQAIYCYNHKRPHTALGYEFPAVVHRQAA
jgi:transposase InsO family protein